MQIPAVSVVIPNLHSPMIGEVIAAIRAQDYSEPFEMIVVGMDRFGQVEEDEQVRFLRTEQPTPPAIARNLGARSARAELLVFIDSDCLPARDWLRRLTAHFTEPTTQVVGGGVNFPDRPFWTFCDNLATFYEFLHTSPAGLRDQLPSLNLAVRREFFLKVGGFDERYPLPAGEDADLTTRMRLSGADLYFDPQAVIHHHPWRRDLCSLFVHSWNFGRFSIKTNPQYRGTLRIPFFLKHWLLTLLTAPLLAAGVMGKILLRNVRRRGVWLALPVIFLMKWAWCFGAAHTLRNGSPLEIPA